MKFKTKDSGLNKVRSITQNFCSRLDDLKRHITVLRNDFRSFKLRQKDRSSFVSYLLLSPIHIFLMLLPLMLTSCGEHSGRDIKLFTGEYRYYAGIAEFFDCKDRVKYFVSKKIGINSELKEDFLSLGLRSSDDAYIRVKGYIKAEDQLQGMDPVSVFVPVELVKFDKNRGCKRSAKQGG